MELFNDFAKEVHRRKGKGSYVDRNMQQAYAARFTDALIQGIGGKDVADAFAYNSSQAATIAKLKANVYSFSCAKSLSEANQMATLIHDDKGILRSFAQFRNEVETINKLYNENYLQTEYNTAIAQAEAAVKWDNIQANKHVLGCLRFKTMEDGRVRPEHAALNNIKRPVDDEWWNTYYPPLSWNCRCTVIPETCGRDTSSAENAIAAGKHAGVKPMFKTNVGKTKVAFDATHPYYKNVSGSLTELDAEKNYGMKSWAQMHRLMQDLPPISNAKTKEEYYNWWNDNVKKHGVGAENFVIKDKVGNNILFDAHPHKAKGNFFREHVSDRHEYAWLAHEAVTNPDEQWLYFPEVKKANKIFSFIKYFNNDVIAFVATVQKDGVIKAESIYKIDNEDTFKNLRKGLLVYANKKF